MNAVPAPGRLQAIEAAEERGHEDVGSQGGPGDRRGCRLYNGDGWLIARGPTWAACIADLDSDDFIEQAEGGAA